MKKQKLTKKQRKEIAYKEYGKIKVIAYKKYEKIVNPAWREYLRECEEIDNEPEKVEKIKIIDGRKYKLVEELTK